MELSGGWDMWFILITGTLWYEHVWYKTMWYEWYGPIFITKTSIPWFQFEKKFMVVTTDTVKIDG